MRRRPYRPDPAEGWFTSRPYTHRGVPDVPRTSFVRFLEPEELPPVLSLIHSSSLPGDFVVDYSGLSGSVPGQVWRDGSLPEELPRSRSSSYGSRRREAPPFNRLSAQLSGLFFSNPHRVTVCMRRRERREVLWARGLAGRSGSAPGPYRRGPDSAWSC